VSSQQEAISSARLRDVSLGLQALVDLLAMHGYALRGGEAEAHLIASYAEHSHRDFVTDHY
jgi:hypothetical protein